MVVFYAISHRMVSMVIIACPNGNVPTSGMTRHILNHRVDSVIEFENYARKLCTYLFEMKLL